MKFERSLGRPRWGRPTHNTRFVKNTISSLSARAPSQICISCSIWTRTMRQDTWDRDTPAIMSFVRRILGQSTVLMRYLGLFLVRNSGAVLSQWSLNMWAQCGAHSYSIGKASQTCLASCLGYDTLDFYARAVLWTSRTWPDTDRILKHMPTTWKLWHPLSLPM